MTLSLRAFGCVLTGPPRAGGTARVRRASCTIIAAFCGVLVASGAVSAAQWKTTDGLAVSLSDQTGAVQAVIVDGQPLALTDEPRGGLFFQEYTRDPAQPQRTVVDIDAEGDRKNWSAASYADWEVKGDYVTRVTGQDPERGAYLRIGDGKTPGVGMAATGRFELPAGSECTVSWVGRTNKIGLTYILCLRVFDEEGKDVTSLAGPPQGWGYSPYSNAHYRCDPGHTKPDTWQRLSFDYMTPQRVAYARLSLRVYRDGDLSADIDDIRVRVRPGGTWSRETPVLSPLEAMADGLGQRAELGGVGLSFATQYFAQEGRLRATVEVERSGPGDDGRCLRLLYRLPIKLEGWTWSADPNRDEIIHPTVKYEEPVGLAGHPLSRYPVASVSTDGVGLAMAAPLDQPALQTFYADPSGLVTAVDVGLSPLATRARARFSLSLYRHEPQWTFRAALRRYYALFPGLFDVRAPRGGAWTLRLLAADVANPEEFGLAFYECGGIGQKARDYCKDHGIQTFYYSEPWGRRQSFPQAKSRSDLPAYEDRLDTVRKWAQQEGGVEKWRGAPRAETARAVLNSLLVGPDGIGAHMVDLYSSWSQWWQLSTDPDLPQPNIASICRQYEIDPALQWADGIYLDSVSMAHTGFEDYDPMHLAAADLPLSFSMSTGRPVALSGLAHLEFMSGLQAQLHRRGKLLMLNLFPPATRLYGHIGDVVGCELAGPQEDRAAMQQRVYAARRPVSNLLQWRFAVLTRAPAMTPDQIEQYFANQLLYGFWPGISTAGGGTQPGYRYMHRYFNAPELFERDRPLFRKYIPVFDALNQAGWEPITHVRSDNPQVRVERFGSGKDALLTVHNTAPEPVQTVLTFDRSWWQAALGKAGDLALNCRLTAQVCNTRLEADALTCRVRIAGKRTLVLQPQRG